MNEQSEASAYDFKPDFHIQLQQIDQPPNQEVINRSKCLYVIGHLGIIYFVIMAIICILIHYALIKKSQISLKCDQLAKKCSGKIEFIHSQDQTYFELASKCPPNRVHGPVQINFIHLLNSSHNNISLLAIPFEQQPNAYSYYRHLSAVCLLNLINSYSVVIQFNNTIPEPFMRDLTLIIRQKGMFNQDETLTQAIICIIFASFVAFFNVSTKIMEKHDNIKPPKIKEKVDFHRVMTDTPEDIQQIDKNLENIRQIALRWIVKTNEKTEQFSESDSEYSFLSA